ncbi:MAG: hypothetical protein EBY61_08605, partial [Actinobacteria bacterium]|nr:hypothetical protein [Actinomycetota bacterium]
MKNALMALFAFALLAAACGDDDSVEPELSDGGSVTLMTHDSFVVSDGVLGLDAELFEVYESGNLDGVFPELRIDDQHRVTPIDFGDVCVNYWIDALPDGAEPPTTLEDLTDPVYADQLVVMSPESSSPGLAFLLATVNGTDDWEQYWADLVVNGVSVTAGWSDAYYGEFTAG